MENRTTTVRGRYGTWALGSLAVFFFVLEAVTGFGLVFEFQPSPDSAPAEVLDLREASPLGWVSKLHHWGSHALMIVVWLHLVRMFMLGRYTVSHRRDWVLGVLSLVPIVLLAVTGARLPTASGAEAASGANVWRFYVVHCLLLPAVAAGLVFVHVRRARQGTTALPADPPEAHEAG